jgi:hypothetical protein
VRLGRNDAGLRVGAGSPRAGSDLVHEDDWQPFQTSEEQSPAPAERLRRLRLTEIGEPTEQRRQHAMSPRR